MQFSFLYQKMAGSAKSLFFYCFLTMMISLASIAEANTTLSLPHYKMQSSIVPQKHRLSTNLNIDFPSEYLTEAQARFLIARSAEIEQIKAIGMTRYEIIELDETLKQITIFFEKADLPEMRVMFKYSLEIPTDHPINRITKNWIELNIDSFWHPVFASFPRFNYELELKIDESYKVQTGDRIIKGTRPELISIQNLIPRRDISFSAAPSFYIKKGKYAEVYSSLPGSKADSVQLLSDKALKFLQSYIDQPADFEHVRKIIISPRKEVGYARKNYIVLSDISKETEESLSSFIAHEFSHYWFSEANLNSIHHWLTESFAEYLSMIYLRKAYGKKAFRKDLEKKRDRIKEENKPLAEFTGRPSYLALYHRGPLVLHAFEEYLGKKKFQRLLNRMIDRNISTNEELFDEIELLFGQKALMKLQELRADI